MFCKLRLLVLLLLPTLLGVGLSACSIISSDTPFQFDQEQRAPNGVFYALPRGVVEIALTGNGGTGQFKLVISDPKYVPDHRYNYFVRHRPLPNFEDDLKISLNPNSVFLKSIKSQSLDRTGDIVVNLARAAAAFGGFESNSATGDIVIAKELVDPTNENLVADMSNSMTVAMQKFARKKHKHCRQYLPKLKDDDDEDERLAFAKEVRVCRELRRIARGAVAVSIDVTRLGTAANVTRLGEHTETDCSVGVCYKPLEPYKITYSIGGVQDTKLIDLPNLAPVIAIDFKRALFVNKIKNVTFDENGILRKVHIQKPSEILAATQIPLAVAGAIAEGLQLRIDYVQRNIDIAKSQEREIAAQGRLAEKLESEHHGANNGEIDKLASHNSSNSAAATYLPTPRPEPKPKSEPSTEEGKDTGDGPDVADPGNL